MLKILDLQQKLPEDKTETNKMKKLSNIRLQHSYISVAFGSAFVEENLTAEDQ